MRRYRIVLTAFLLLSAITVACQGSGAAKSEAPAEKPAASMAASGTPIPVKAKVPVKLFIMSHCPFGKGAEGVLLKAMKALPGVIDLDLGFVITQLDKPGEFKSLHGPEEVALDKVQACVEILYKDQLLDFIDLDNTTTEPWQDAAKSMGFDIAAIEGCVADGRADESLAKDAGYNKAMNISASPTLFFAGHEYTGPISSLDLFEATCQALGEDKPDVCNNPPETLSRSDGATAGRCGGDDAAPKIDPSMVDETAFEHTVIVPSEAFTDDSGKILTQTKALFPKANVVQLSDKDPKAKKLIEEYKIEWLPAFIFPKEIEKTKNFDKMRSVMSPLGEGAKAYQLDPMKIGANYSLKRPAKPETIDILYTPYSARSLTLLMDIIDTLNTPEFTPYKGMVRFLPMAHVDPKGDLRAQRGDAELEEIQRNQAVLDIAPDKFRAYLEARRPNPTGSYWEDFCKAAGLDPTAVKTAALGDETKTKLTETAKLATDLGIGLDIAFFVNNREVAQVQDKDDFKRLLRHVKGMK